MLVAPWIGRCPWIEHQPLNASTVGVYLMSFSGSETRPVGFPELKRNLINRPLRPFVGFRKPKFSTVPVKQSPFSAQQFLITNFSQFTHYFNSPRAKAIKYLRNMTVLRQRTMS